MKIILGGFPIDTDEAVRNIEKIRQEMIASMVDAMPKGTPDPEGLARKAVKAFEDAKWRCWGTKLIHVTEEVVAEDYLEVHKAMCELECALADLRIAADARLMDEMKERGVKLDILVEWLNIMQEIVASPPEKEPRDPWRPTQDTTVAVVAAVECLMAAGIKRKRAALIVSLMMDRYSKIRPGTPKKTAGNIEVTMRNRQKS